MVATSHGTKFFDRLACKKQSVENSNFEASSALSLLASFRPTNTDRNADFVSRDKSSRIRSSGIAAIAFTTRKNQQFRLDRERIIDTEEYYLAKYTVPRQLHLYCKSTTTHHAEQSQEDGDHTKTRHHCQSVFTSHFQSSHQEQWESSITRQSQQRR